MTDESAVCDCVMDGDTPSSAPRCDDEYDGYICTRPEGHDGPHTSCNVAQHPAVTWE